MSSSQPPQSRSAAVVEDLTDGFTANRPLPDGDTSTAVRGSAADSLVGGEPAGGVATQSNSAAVARHDNKDIELPRVGNNNKPDITNERAPTAAEAAKHAPTFNPDNVPVNDE